jgi:hypothetical protein
MVFLSSSKKMPDHALKYVASTFSSLIQLYISYKNTAEIA